MVRFVWLGEEMCMKEELRCAVMECGALYIEEIGTVSMQEWPVDNLDYLTFTH